MPVVWMLMALAAFFALWIFAVAARGNAKARMAALRPWRYAHRGYHARAAGVPENSLAAFRLAAARGFGAELDVHLTKDGQLAVLHDASLLRTAGAAVFVEDLTAAELAAYRLEGTAERIPLLEEVLPVFAGVAPLIIELKAERGNSRALSAALWARLLDYRGEYCIESFDPRVLLWFRLHRPEVIRGQLSCYARRSGVRLGVFQDFILRNLLTNFLTLPDFVAYDHCRRRNPSLWLCRKVWGAQEVSWTVRDAAALAALERDGAMVIFEGFDPGAKR